MKKLKKFILAGLLLSVSVVFNRFLSIKTPIVVISLGFIPKIIIGTLFNCWWSAFLFGLADLIGSLLFPFGAYFVGYTISAVISGFIYGLFLYRKKGIKPKKYLVRLIISCIISNLICNLLLNSIWVTITSGKAIFAILPTRLIKVLITIPIYVAVMFGIYMFFEKYKIYDMVLGNSNESIEDENLDNEELEIKKEKSEKLKENNVKIEDNENQNGVGDNSVGDSNETIS